jgi:hypothetical protein
MKNLSRSLIVAALLLSFASESRCEPTILSANPALSRDAWSRWRRSGGEWPPQPTVKLYEKFELDVDLRADFDNPYDPEQIDLSAEFTAPSGKVWKIWGFYCPRDWSSQWKVRFTPTEVGSWSCVVHVRDRSGVTKSDPIKLEVNTSDHPGFVGIAPNGRYLKHSDGSSFYGIGLWYNDGYHRRSAGAITEESLDELRSLGVNFISFFHTPLETNGTGLGRYDQNLAERLDQVFEWCEQREMRISWNLVFHSHISEEVWGGGNARYRNNPYRNVAPADEFFTSDEAWRYQQKLYRYVIARWGYSRALYLWFVIDEINGTEGWTEGGPEGAEAWCRNMNDFLHENDPYDRPTTGTQSGGLSNWWPEGYRIFDIAGREIYEAQGHPMPAGGKPDLLKKNPLQFSYRNYAGQVSKLWEGFDKPAIIAECGWDHTYYEPGMPGYLAMHHNAMWAALASGSCATPFWWAHSSYMNDSVVTAQFRSIARFTSRIDFANRDWQPAKIAVSNGDAWAMSDGTEAVGWYANLPSGVANEKVTLKGLPDGEYRVRLYRTWRGRFMSPMKVTSSGGALTFVLPELVAEEGHGQYIGDDIAFRIESAR